MSTGVIPIDPDEFLLEDAWDIAGMRVVSGQAPPIDKWVTEMIHRANLDTFACLG